ncbi:MAG: hypothetical protein V1774_10760 [Candidatus Eisenbacteria bacterium]
MPLDPRPETYSAFLDERTETWHVRVDARGNIPLDRASLSHLVSLYNQIHRGNPLTLIERRTLHELGRERNSLHETVRNLYDFIDAETDADWAAQPPEAGAPNDPGPGRAGTGPAAPVSDPLERTVRGIAGWIHRLRRRCFSRTFSAWRSTLRQPR